MKAYGRNVNEQHMIMLCSPVLYQCYVSINLTGSRASLCLTCPALLSCTGVQVISNTVYQVRYGCEVPWDLMHH